VCVVEEKVSPRFCAIVYSYSLPWHLLFRFTPGHSPPTRRRYSPSNHSRFVKRVLKIDPKCYVSHKLSLGTSLEEGVGICPNLPKRNGKDFCATSTRSDILLLNHNERAKRPNIYRELQ